MDLPLRDAVEIVGVLNLKRTVELLEYLNFDLRGIAHKSTNAATRAKDGEAQRADPDGMPVVAAVHRRVGQDGGGCEGEVRRAGRLQAVRVL